MGVYGFGQGQTHTTVCKTSTVEWELPGGSHIKGKWLVISLPCQSSQFPLVCWQTAKYLATHTLPLCTYIHNVYICRHGISVFMGTFQPLALASMWTKRSVINDMLMCKCINAFGCTGKYNFTNVYIMHQYYTNYMIVSSCSSLISLHEPLGDLITLLGDMIERQLRLII